MRRWTVALTAQARQGVRRVRGSFVPMVQAALAAALAYAIAEHVFGRTAPMFAPIAAWVCLGFKADRVPRKVAELGVGATVGVLIGEVFVLGLGAGTWQLGLALLTGAVVGRFLDRGDLTTIQAGVNAVVVVSMSWWQSSAGGVTGRWIDALVGAGVAFVVAVLLPRKPTVRARRYARTTLTEYATLLGMVARGLRAGDVSVLADARAQRRAVGDVMLVWETTLTSAREVVALNPSLRRYRPEVAELSRIFRLLGRTQRASYLLARQGLAMTEEVGPMPEVGALLDEVAAALHGLAAAVGNWHRPERPRAVLLAVAAQAAPGGLGDAGWRSVALMSLLRSVVVDLLQVSGMSREQARASLSDSWDPDAGGRDGDDSPIESDDDASPLWA